MLQPRDYLICLAVKYSGDWDLIYNAIANKEELPDSEVIETNKLINSKVLTMLDENYPEHLRLISKPPFVLFYHGDISLIKDTNKMISVVGSRLCSKYGEEITIKLVNDLAKELVIVSGMASGIDSISHRACIKSGGKTVAVLGCGINYCYPHDNFKLYNEIKKNHLVISEFPDKTEPTQKQFPIRNRIIAGLTHCLLITEGHIKSGTAITARLMLEGNGDVCCVPAHAGEESICNHLIANGAALVETAEDVFEEMGYKKMEALFKNHD